MALTTALIQIRTSLIPPPEPGHNDYSDCQQSLTVKYIDSNTRTEKEKNIRRPYPKYAVRTLETKRSDQIIEFDKFWTIERELGVYVIEYRRKGYCLIQTTETDSKFSLFHSTFQRIIWSGISGQGVFNGSHVRDKDSSVRTSRPTRLAVRKLSL